MEQSPSSIAAEPGSDRGAGSAELKDTELVGISQPIWRRFCDRRLLLGSDRHQQNRRTVARLLINTGA
jgi:hypothetical protein